MRGEKRLRILNFLENAGYTIGDLFLIFTLPYGTSIGKGLKMVEKFYQERESREIDQEERLRFYDLLYHLRKEGLITSAKIKGKKIFQLTNKGKEKLEKLRLRKSASGYEIKTDNLLKIIIFDIPEKQRRMRAWLREALINLEFNMLQKSVWVGKTKIPEEFIHQLKKLNLLPFVEIFEISKTGSLKQIK